MVKSTLPSRGSLTGSPIHEPTTHLEARESWGSAQTSPCRTAGEPQNGLLIGQIHVIRRSVRDFPIGDDIIKSQPPATIVYCSLPIEVSSH